MLTVYVAGLIHFDGCIQPPRIMYAPDGSAGSPPHYASLWVAADLIDEDETQWWEGFRHSYKDGDVVEFRMPNPVEILFPEGDPGECWEFEKLSKMKKKDKPDDPEEDFVVNPAAAQTIAKATIGTGDLTPRRFKNMSVVVWTIKNPPMLRITTRLQANPGDSRTITLKPFAEGVTAELVFANTHAVFGEKQKFPPHDEHDLNLFKKLNPLAADAVLVLKKFPGSVGQLVTDNDVIQELKDIKYAGGDPPNCCPN